MASSSARYDSSILCSLCSESLIAPNPSTPEIPLIDDVLLPNCSHHFHWTCLVEDHTSSPPPPSTNEFLCPRADCRRSTLNSEDEYLVIVRNEGGVIENFDMGEEVRREAFLEGNPWERRKEVFLGLAAQGDWEEAERFLRGSDDLVSEEGGEGNGPISPDASWDGGSTTALHVAALNDDVTGVQLLLRYGADRAVRTEDGFTALDLARSQGAENVVRILMQ